MDQDKEKKDSSLTGFSLFWDKILSFLGLGDPADREKKQLLKEIKKSVKRSRYKVLNINDSQAQVPMAKFFFQIYSLVGPAQHLLENARNSEALKTIVIESQLSPDKVDLIQRLQKEALIERAKKIPISELSEDVKENLLELTAAFNSDKVRQINQLYNSILIFLDFLDFNYFFMLKKFDAGLPERDFNYIPRFESIDGTYILDDLKDFLEVFFYVSPTLPWDAVFDVFRFYKDLEVVARGPWKKALSNMEAVKRSGILLDVVKFLEQDPYYKVVGKPPQERIVDSFLDRIQTQTETMIHKIQSDKRTNKKNQLVQLIFGTTGVSRTKNYTEKGHLNYSKKGLSGFSLVEPMNYLKAFILDTYKRDIRELVNLLLVTGQWATNAMSQPLSDSFHHLMSFSDKISEFDEALAEDGERGSKLKTMALRSERDVNAKNLLSKMLNEINDEAMALVTGAANHLIVVGKHIKLALEDQAKVKHDVILNWKSLEVNTEKDLRTWMSDIYKSIYYFIQLMQFFTKDSN